MGCGAARRRKKHGGFACIQPSPYQPACRTLRDRRRDVQSIGTGAHQAGKQMASFGPLDRCGHGGP